jgi:hypothetical protein
LASAAVIGWDTLFQLFTRQVTLQELVDKASQRIGIKGRVIIWSQAEPCMDVDKPHQLEIMREDLTLRKRKEAAAKKTTVTKNAAKKTPAKKVALPKTRTSTIAKAKKK